MGPLNEDWNGSQEPNPDTPVQPDPSVPVDGLTGGIEGLEYSDETTI